MKVVSFRAGGCEAVGLLEGERVIDFTRAHAAYCAARGIPGQPAAHSILHMLQAGLFGVELFSQVRDFVQQHGLSDDLTADDPTLLAPIPRPPRIVALGRNYAAHAAESGHDAPKEPIFFVKASTAVIGPEEAVAVPRGVGRVDHEVEVAVIIGKAGRRITRRQCSA